MSGHTPGPWTWYQPQVTPSQNSYSAAFVLGPKRVPMDRSEGFTAADARLIAAAPDLLEALNGMLEAYESLVNCGDCGYWDVEKDKEVIVARAAISKAKGESQ